MNKLYSVHDHWTDINKKNDVDIESIDGVITGIKVNGEDYGGGGGGSSDFSTLAVTVDNESNEDIHLNFIPVSIVEHIIQDVGKSAVMLLPNGLMASSDASPGANANSTEVHKFLLAKDSNFTLISNWGAKVPNNITVSGNAEKSYFTDQGQNLGGIIITGDCTITIS